jgi:hypothetical protein
MDLRERQAATRALRARSWSVEHQDWVCSVEIWVDDCGVIITVPADRVELVAAGGTHHG